MELVIFLVFFRLLIFLLYSLNPSMIFYIASCFLGEESIIERNSSLS